MISMLGNNLFYQQLHKKMFSLFSPLIQTIYKCQCKILKIELMEHMTTVFGHVFNLNSIDSMVGKNLKSV